MELHGKKLGKKNIAYYSWGLTRAPYIIGYKDEIYAAFLQSSAMGTDNKKIFVLKYDSTQDKWNLVNSSQYPLNAIQIDDYTYGNASDPYIFTDFEDNLILIWSENAAVYRKIS